MLRLHVLHQEGLNDNFFRTNSKWTKVWRLENNSRPAPLYDFETGSCENILNRALANSQKSYCPELPRTCKWDGCDWLVNTAFSQNHNVLLQLWTQKKVFTPNKNETGWSKLLWFDILTYLLAYYHIHQKLQSINIFMQPNPFKWYIFLLQRN